MNTVYLTALSRRRRRGKALYRKVFIALAVGVWLSLIAVGLLYLVDYSIGAGEQGVALSEWPMESALTTIAGESTLVVFVHPQCPCSVASLTELNIIMNQEHERAAARVVFLRPDGVKEDWEKTATWSLAGNIPNTTRFVDFDGVEAKRFGALTSGHAVLYNPEGQLLFAGGITGSRGHHGNNMGRQTIITLLEENLNTRRGHDVFGCSMFGPADAREGTTP